VCRCLYAKVYLRFGLICADICGISVEMNIYREIAEQINSLAKRAFERHTLTRVNGDLYRCARPDEWCYGFYLQRLPHGWCITGDIGDAIIIRCNTEGWLRGAAKSPEYLFEKMVNVPKRMYYGDVIERIEEIEEWCGQGYVDVDTDTLRSEVESAYTEYGDGNSVFSAVVEIAFMDATDDFEAVPSEKPTERCLWLLEAIKCFVRLYEETYECTE